MLGIIAAVAQVYYFLHESAVCRFRATVVFSVYQGEKLCFRQYEMVHYLFCFEGLHLFISVRTLIYGQIIALNTRKDCEKIVLHCFSGR